MAMAVILLHVHTYSKNSAKYVACAKIHIQATNLDPTVWDWRRYACNQYILISGMLVPRVPCNKLFFLKKRTHCLYGSLGDGYDEGITKFKVC